MIFIKMVVTVDPHRGIKPLSQSRRCILESYTHLGYRIFPHYFKSTCEVPNIHKSCSTPCLSQTIALNEDFDTNPHIAIVGDRRIPRVHALVVEVAIAMASGASLLPVPSGLGGAYFLCSRNGDNIVVVKPIDEEPLAFNNPKGFGGRMLGQPGLKRSVRIGESGIRELAAYLLDHGEFAGVPPTALVKISHVAFCGNNNAAAISVTPYKIASVQRFVDYEFDAGELGFSGFSIASVHHIGILDIRILNLDRHAGNMLVKKSEQTSYAIGVTELVPIDHGLSFPEWLDDPYFEWLHWPQASIPFSESEIEYISNLNPFKDAELLRTHIPSLREAAIRVIVLCTIFLKRATAAGLCLADIGEMMTRQFYAGEQRLSALENLCLQVKATILVTNSEGIETTGECKIFQHQNDTKGTFDEHFVLPQLLQIYAGMTRFSSLGSITELTDAYIHPLFKESNHRNDDYDTKNMKGNSECVDCSTSTNDSHKVGGALRSLSFTANNLNRETEAISFGDMSNVEWDLFLDNFERLLPNILLKSIRSDQIGKKL